MKNLSEACLGRVARFKLLGSSSGLLVYVYHEHWLEVGWSSVKLAVVETVPLGLILVLGNIAIQFMYHFGSVLEGLVGVLLPNGYLKVTKSLEFHQFAQNNKSFSLRLNYSPGMTRVHC